MGQAFLVVDDSKLARMVARKALHDLRPDCTVLEAASALEADRFADAEEVAAAFIDVNMPGEDGLELAARLRRRRPHLPIAIVSANAQTHVLERAGALDAVFMEKPLSETSVAHFIAARVGGAPEAPC